MLAAAEQCFLLFVLEAGSLCVALAVLELSVDQAGLRLGDPPDSVSQVLELKVLPTHPV